MRVSLSLTIALISLTPISGFAQYPSKSIRLIVPYDAGGPTDLMARAIGPLISNDLGQSVVIENRPGAGTVIGSGYVAKSPSDGYTYLINGSALSVNVSIVPKMPFDTLKDLVGVAPVGITPYILFASGSLPANSMKELVALAKAAPGSISYGSSGNGTIPRLAGALLALKTNTDMVHVGYKGTAPAINDMLGGNLNLFFTGVSSGLPYLQTGKLKALAAASDERNAALPNVPTMAEAGVVDLRAEAWYGIFAPSATPPEIKERFALAVRKALKNPEVTARFEKLGIVAFKESDSTVSGIDAYFRKDTAYWKRFVDANPWILKDQ